MNREKANTERTEAFKNGQRIGYFDHNLKCLILDGDDFTNRRRGKTGVLSRRRIRVKASVSFSFNALLISKLTEAKKAASKFPTSDYGRA